tara:strand:+ start:29 stop:592 length:564 start_codon:yes stop_codon:yes gene_type:complete
MKNIFAHLGRTKKPAKASPLRPLKAADEPDDKKEPVEGEDDPDDKKEPVEGEDDPDDKKEPAEGEEDLEDDDEADPEKEKEAAHRKGVIEGRKRERERCAAIFASEHAAGREGLAATLAFTTSLTAKQAVVALQSTAPGKGGGLAAAMAAHQNPNLGTGGGSETPGTAGNALLANAQKRAEASKKRA